MNLFRRTIPTTLGLLVLGGFELMTFRPELIPFVGPFLVVCAAAATFGIVGRGLRDPDFVRFSVLLTLFLSAAVGFFLFLERPIFQHGFNLLVAGSLWVYLVNLLTFTVAPQRYQPYALENFTANLALATIVFASVTAFDLDVFFGVSLFLLIPAVSLAALAVGGTSFWVSKYFPGGWPYLLVVSLIVTETTVAVSFLPSTPLIKGAIVTVSYYLSVEVSRAVLRKESLRDELPRPILLATLLVLALLATAKWQ